MEIENEIGNENEREKENERMVEKQRWIAVAVKFHRKQAAFWQDNIRRSNGGNVGSRRSKRSKRERRKWETE